MTKQEKLEIVKNAYTLMEKGGEMIPIFNQNLRDNDAIMTIQYALDAGVSFDLRYEIMKDACDWISDNIKSVEDFKNDDAQETFQNTFEPCVYTSTQISWLTQFNQQDISDIMKEYELNNIAEACAVWYKNRVEDAVIALSEYIMQ